MVCALAVMMDMACEIGSPSGKRMGMSGIAVVCARRRVGRRRRVEVRVSMVGCAR